MAEQIPGFERTNAAPDARYDLGCVYIGVNDVRRIDWDPDAFRAGIESTLQFLHGRCDRVLTMTAPMDGWSGCLVSTSASICGGRLMMSDAMPRMNPVSRRMPRTRHPLPRISRKERRHAVRGSACSSTTA